MGYYSLITQDDMLNIKPEFEDIADIVCNFSELWEKIPMEIKNDFKMANLTPNILANILWMYQIYCEENNITQAYPLDNLIHFFRSMKTEITFSSTDLNYLFYHFKDGWIELDDYCCKHYADKLLMNLLLELMDKNQKVRFYFEGDDGDCWGYELNTSEGIQTFRDLVKCWDYAY